MDAATIPPPATTIPVVGYGLSFFYHSAETAMVFLAVTLATTIADAATTVVKLLSGYFFFHVSVAATTTAYSKQLTNRMK